jgi:hypothetical protein
MKNSPIAVAPDRAGWESAIENDLDDISRRNDALLFRIIPERATVTAKFTMGDVKVSLTSLYHDRILIIFFIFSSFLTLSMKRPTYRPSQFLIRRWRRPKTSQANLICY